MANASLKRWHLVQDLNDEKNVDRQDQGEEHFKQPNYKEKMIGKQEIQVRMLKIHPLNGEDREITGRRAQSMSSHVDHYKDFDFY